MGVEIVGQIEKINCKELSYGDFAENYLAKNQPVVISGLTDDWRSREDWVSENGLPNLHFFATHFGKSRVQVADCERREFTDQKRLEMSVTEFIKQWTDDSIEDSGKDDKKNSVLYLKDWHFVKEYTDYTAYQTPPLFSDDWLNMYLDSYQMHEDRDHFQKYDQIACSDYRFVYMGGKGSWTPLHADVFRSYSWSANVCGRKRWLLLPPPQSHLVYDRYMKNCIYNIFEEVNETKFPGFKETTWLECIQEPGDVIFVPSGWHHQVHNLEDTVSINHNWLNAYNLSCVWDLLWRDYKDTEESIEDIRDISDDFEDLCQRNLAANTGMNLNDFFIFMSRFSLGNMVLLETYSEKDKSLNSCLSSMAHNLLLNLSTIQKIMMMMISAGGVTAKDVYLDLREAVEDPQFLRLVRDMGRTYAMIHKEEENLVLFSKEMLSKMTGFADQKMQICSPKDLVEMIDRYNTCSSHLLA
ncbi:unnamed protein product [Microthlaspi erraticum]|uniref:JmjC domain-containing protein n=1 Tax=Microthlaspi erraticum TaxID=1685480 RepID=A0A6D2J5E6_9BRAS|nr:unnamed protein product [Microthlaspi erraticum]